MFRAGGTFIGVAVGAVCDEDRGRVVDDQGVVDGVGAAEDDGNRALAD